MINFKPKGAALKKRTPKKRISPKVRIKGLSRKDVAEMNLFGRIIAQMNAKVR